jgi:NADPH:quinone reductase-like Zn-dependent oxidoreductase
MKPGVIPLSCGAGEVVETGMDVSCVAVGEHVAGIFSQNWIASVYPPHPFTADLGTNADGMLSQYRIMNEQGSSFCLPICRSSGQRLYPAQA